MDETYEEEFEAEDPVESKTDPPETHSTSLLTTTAEVHAPLGPDVGDPMGIGAGVEVLKTMNMAFPLSGVVAERSVADSSSQVASTWFSSVDKVKTEEKDVDIKSDTSSGEVEILKEGKRLQMGQRWRNGGFKTLRTMPVRPGQTL